MIAPQTPTVGQMVKATVCFFAVLKEHPALEERDGCCHWRRLV